MKSKSVISRKTDMASSLSSTISSMRHSNIENNYEGAQRYYKCKYKGMKVKAPRWTSWTIENPGRRFYACPNYEVSM